MQLFKELFDETPIEGLTYLPEFISSELEQRLISDLDQWPWSQELRRRVQHFGFKYDYKSKGLDQSSYLGLLPQFLHQIRDQIFAAGFFQKIPNQVIANEYLPGQGISAHVDCVACFGDVVASLSLNSNCIMQFERENSDMRFEQVLERRSLIILSGPARYHWLHSIPARKSDRMHGVYIPRKRRISLTFRTVDL